MAVGEHQRALLGALTGAGFATAARPRLRMDMLPDQAQARIMDLYRALGGIQHRPTFTPGGWDCPLVNGLIVELDELQHFNRYRAATLEPGWTIELPWRQPYLEYCAAREGDCLRAKAGRGFWSTPKAGLMFEAATTGVKTLDGPGSPRWKQRALYDAMRDIAAVSGVVRLARLAIFDRVGDASLGLALEGRAPLDLDQLLSLVTARTLATE
jgi:hypothetical protein